MKRIIVKTAKAVRKLVSPKRTTAQALNLFTVALAHLEEVRLNQALRISNNQAKAIRASETIERLHDRVIYLHNDMQYARREMDSAAKAEEAIRKLIAA